MFRDDPAATCSIDLKESHLRFDRLQVLRWWTHNFLNMYAGLASSQTLLRDRHLIRSSALPN